MLFTSTICIRFTHAFSFFPSSFEYTYFNSIASLLMIFILQLYYYHFPIFYALSFFYIIVLFTLILL